MLRSARLSCLLVLALLALPAGAGAAVVQVTTSPGLTAALSAAAANVDADTINLAAGTYVGPFSYGGSGPVEIVGAGVGATVIQTASGIALNLAGSASGNRVADLTATITAGGTVFGLRASSPDATIEDVAVTKTGGASVFAIQTLGASDIVRRATVDGGFARAFEVQGGSALLTDITATLIGGTGIDVDAAGATATVRRARISGASSGAQATFSGALTITDSLLDMRGSPGSALGVGDGGNNAPNTSALTADRVTLIGNALSPPAVRVDAGTVNEADMMSITLHDSIISGFTTALACNEGGTVPQGTITVNDSALTGQITSTCSDPPLDPGVTRTNVTSAVPGFIDPAADFRLRWDSPLIDFGATTPGLTITDLGGLERVIDGDGAGIATVDLGAYEYQRRAPVISSAAGMPASPAIGAAVAFDAAATDADPLESPLLSYAWSFDDGATATGPSTSHAFASSGAHVATVRVTDPAGASATQAVIVTVPVPPKTPDPSPAPAPSPPPVKKIVFTAAGALTLPGTKACLSRRSFALRLRMPKGLTAKDLTITISGRRARVVKGRALTAPINLTGLPKGRVKVTISVRASDGRKVTLTRSYRLCARKRR